MSGLVRKLKQLGSNLLSGDMDRPSNDQSLSEYNILVLGEKGSRKSTLLEYMIKNNMSAATKSKTIPRFFSHTPKVSIETIITDLRECKVTEINGIQAIHNVEASRLQRPARFNVINTPDFHRTRGDVQQHVQKVFHSLTEAKTIHLVVVTLTEGMISQGVKDVVTIYTEMFPDFNGIIVFIHMSIQDSHISMFMTYPERQRVNEVMGRSFPHFEVKCTDEGMEVNAAEYCIAQNTVQKILELATFNRPVDMWHTVISKTRKMREIDDALWGKLEPTSGTIKRIFQRMSPDEQEILTEMYHREIQVRRLEARIKTLKEFFDLYDVESLELLHEVRRDTSDGISTAGTRYSIRYPETGELDFSIDSRDLFCRNVEIISETGSKDDAEPWRSWQAKVHRTSPMSVFHVRIYATKSNVHQAKIREKHRELMELQQELQMAIHHRDGYSHRNDSRKRQIEETIDKKKEGIHYLELVTSEFLTLKVLQALIDADAYSGGDDACVKKVQSVYKAQASGNPAKHDLIEPEEPEEYVLMNDVSRRN